MEVENFSNLYRLNMATEKTQCNPFQININTAPPQTLGLFPFAIHIQQHCNADGAVRFCGLSEQL